MLIGFILGWMAVFYINQVMENLDTSLARFNRIKNRFENQFKDTVTVEMTREEYKRYSGEKKPATGFRMGFTA